MKGPREMRCAAVRSVSTLSPSRQEIRSIVLRQMPQTPGHLRLRITADHGLTTDAASKGRGAGRGNKFWGGE